MEGLWKDSGSIMEASWKDCGSIMEGLSKEYVRGLRICETSMEPYETRCGSRMEGECRILEVHRPASTVIKPMGNATIRIPVSPAKE